MKTKPTKIVLNVGYVLVFCMFCPVRDGIIHICLKTDTKM